MNTICAIGAPRKNECAARVQTANCVKRIGDPQPRGGAFNGIDHRDGIPTSNAHAIIWREIQKQPWGSVHWAWVSEQLKLDLI